MGLLPVLVKRMISARALGQPFVISLGIHIT